MNLEDYQVLTNIQKAEYFESLPSSIRDASKLVVEVGCYDLDKPRNANFKYNGRYYTRNSPIFSAWLSMLLRCYDKIPRRKMLSYKDTTVCQEWLTFSNFYSWWKDNYVEGWQLDKDILTDNNQYSPDNCLYVPNWLNNFTIANGKRRGQYLIGVYLCKNSNKFRARCREVGKTVAVHLGLHNTELEAHLAWKSYKLKLALQRKPDMDKIDLRIYPRIIEIINRLK